MSLPRRFVAIGLALALLVLTVLLSSRYRDTEDPHPPNLEPLSALLQTAQQDSHPLVALMHATQGRERAQTANPAMVRDFHDVQRQAVTRIGTAAPALALPPSAV